MTNALHLLHTRSVEAGLVNVSYVDAAVGRLLREKFALHLFDGPGYWQVNETAATALLDAPAHRQLALSAAEAGITLLQNDPAPSSPNGPNTPLLPLAGLGSTIIRVALVSGAYVSPSHRRPAPHVSRTHAFSPQIGPNAGCAAGPTAECQASEAYRGGYCNGGSHTVTLYEALAGVAGINVSFAVGADQLDYNTTGLAAAVAAAAAAQVAIVVVGDTTMGFGKGTCAEGIDADTIDLPGGQLALLSAVAATGTPTVTVLVHGRPATFGAGEAFAVAWERALYTSSPLVQALSPRRVPTTLCSRASPPSFPHGARVKRAATPSSTC